MRRIRLSRLIFNCIWICTIAFCSPFSYATTTDEEEKLFKAAFIYNFAKFTTWPADSWGNDDTPLTLCTIGNDSLTGELNKLNGKQVLSRVLSITTLKQTIIPQQCHLLYIAQSETNNFRRFIENQKTQPTLTIAEISGFAKYGGMIELYRDHGQTRLNINLDSVRKSGLSISSRLLMIARIIQQEKQP